MVMMVVMVMVMIMMIKTENLLKSEKANERMNSNE